MPRLSFSFRKKSIFLLLFFSFKNFPGSHFPLSSRRSILCVRRKGSAFRNQPSTVAAQLKISLQHQNIRFPKKRRHSHWELKKSEKKQQNKNHLFSLGHFVLFFGSVRFSSFEFLRYPNNNDDHDEIGSNDHFEYIFSLTVAKFKQIT